MPQEPIVSFHPSLAGEVNRLLVSQRPLDQRDVAALQGAAAVILPRPCRPDLHDLVAGLGKPHFPRLGLHLSLDGKVGNHALFAGLGLPHPKTVAFATLEQAAAAWQKGDPALKALGPPPWYVKGAGGGEGKNVFLAATPGELLGLAAKGLETACRQGPSGLVLQEAVDTGGRDARVIFVGQAEFAFWKVAAPGEYRSNQKRGGLVSWDGWPGELERVRQLARRLKDLAGLDVAAVDVLTPRQGPCLLMEVNFVFGMLVLGGREIFSRLYLDQARRWLAGLGLDPSRLRLG